MPFRNNFLSKILSKKLHGSLPFVAYMSHHVTLRCTWGNFFQEVALVFDLFFFARYIVLWNNFWVWYGMIHVAKFGSGFIEHSGVYWVIDRNSYQEVCMGDWLAFACMSRHSINKNFDTSLCLGPQGPVPRTVGGQGGYFGPELFCASRSMGDGGGG